MDWDALKKREENKRQAAYDPAERWRHIQETITWAEANLPVHLRRNRPRTAKSRVNVEWRFFPQKETKNRQG